MVNYPWRKNEKIPYNFVRCFKYDDCFSKNHSEREIVGIENFDLIVEVLIKETKKNLNPVQEYALDKIARIYKMYDIKKYDVETIWAYYGYEPDEVTFHDIEIVDNEIKKIINYNYTQIVEYLLVLEYKYILPKLQGLKWSVKKIAIDDIYAGNKEYLRKVDVDNPYDDVLNEHKNYLYNKDMILGVVTAENRLWDGYHRYCAAKKNELQEGTFLYGE